jgi:cytochrome c oxidase subunit 4
MATDKPKKAAAKKTAKASKAAKATTAEKAAAPSEAASMAAGPGAGGVATAVAVHDDEATLASHGEDHHHPSDATYWKIFLFLFVVTAIEVLLYYKSIPGVNLNSAVLGILAIVKFVTVVGYFMHLRFDARILRRLFVTGLVLAVLVYCAYMLTLGVFIDQPGSPR